MDKDHQELIALLGALVGAADSGNKQKTTGAIDLFLVRVRQHFDFEDRLMREHGYAQREAHNEAHASFVQDIERFRQELAKKGLTNAFRQWAGGRLVNWFKFHIKAHDIGLAQAVSPKSRGGKRA